MSPRYQCLRFYDLFHYYWQTNNKLVNINITGFEIQHIYKLSQELLCSCSPTQTMYTTDLQLRPDNLIKAALIDTVETILK